MQVFRQSRQSSAHGVWSLGWKLGLARAPTEPLALLYVVPAVSQMSQVAPLLSCLRLS